MSVSKPTITLNKVQNNFARWRQTRKKRGRIPEELWQQAVTLSHSYKSTNIATALGLNHSDFKNKCLKLNKATDNPTKLVEIKLTHDKLKHPQPESASEAMCRVELERTDGGRVTIQLPVRALDKFFDSFFGTGSQSCYK